MRTQILRFGLSGAAGYLVDSAVLYAMMALGMGFLRGRLVSFVCAVVVTFFLNRRYTFADQLKNAGGPRPPLWFEFGHYLAAMALGGLLNLATYWFVLAVTPHFPALFALAVAAGSLVGMVANFISAKWWVFIGRPEHRGLAFRPFELTTARCLIITQAVFWIAHLTEVTLPGLYMDAVNPDYIAAHILHPELPNAVALLPTPGPPVLGSLYHGVQNLYVGLPVFALLGFNMLALRVAQGLFAGGILVMTQLVLQRASGSLSLAFAGALGLASELAFIASFRTQMYIVMAGAFWLLLAIFLALGRTRTAAAPGAMTAAASTDGWRIAARMPWLLSGLCTGLAVYSYFVFLFFVPVFVTLGWWHTRSWRAPLIWLLGFAVGMQTYVLGYTLALAALGGLGPALEWLRSAAQDLGPMASVQTFPQRLANALSLLILTLQNTGNDVMIFGTAEPGTWSVWKVRLLVIVPLLLTAFGFARRLKSPAPPEAELREPSLLAGWHLALLPLSFVAVSLVFGDRLWSHHFSPLVPVSYVVLFVAVHHLKKALPMTWPGWIGVVLMAVFVVGNLQQQHVFFERLRATGGTAYFSNALNRMADDALSMPAELVHVFPEWGFMMPFALLTANRRTYEIDIGEANLQRLAEAGSPLRLYYWQPESEGTYRDSLLANGYRISGDGVYLQRDQQPAFYWLDAVSNAR